MEQTMTYTCEGCGTTYTGSPQDAFKIGWDTPEQFMSHCTCPNCTIDKTVWWKVVMLKEEPTPEEVQLLMHYNSIYSQYNEMDLTQPNPS
jgi:rubredoxin